MNTVTEKKLYEGMFLVDSAQAASDWDGIVDSIKHTLEREGAEIESLKKWDERSLAYPINGKNRGTYILCYFRVEGPNLEQIERNIQLSEQIVRSLILSTEKMSKEDLEKPTPLEAAQIRAKEAVERAEQKRREQEETEKQAEQQEKTEPEPQLEQDDEDSQNSAETEDENADSEKETE